MTSTFVTRILLAFLCLICGVPAWSGEGVPPLRVVGILPAERGQDALVTEDKAKIASPRTPHGVTTNRPNVILILADDLGYETIGANGGTSYETPVLDRLAATGVRFTHCYVQPRDWVYSWYSPRQSADMTVREFAFNQRYKLYRTGEFFDLANDLDEKQPLSVASLEGAAARAATVLQGALDQFKNARPAELDRAFEQANKGKDKESKAAKRAKRRDKK